MDHLVEDGLRHDSATGAQHAQEVALADWRRYSADACGVRRGSGAPTAPNSHPRTKLLWAQLMARSFDIDVLACLRCGDRLHLIALIESRAAIERILAHLESPTTVRAALPARAPPLPFGAGHWSVDDDESP